MSLWEFFPNEENIEPIAIYTGEGLAPQEQTLTPPTGLRKTVSPAELEMLYLEMDNLQKEKQSKTNNDIQAKLLQTRLSATAIDYNRSKCKFYNGVFLYDVFMTVFTLLSQFMTKTSLSDKCLHRDQLSLTLIKLHLDLPFEFFALQCGLISRVLN